MDGKKKKGKVEATNSMKKANKYELKTKSGSTVEVKGKTVKDARAKTGYFEQKPYKGGIVKNDKGVMTGYKNRAGKFTATPDPVSRVKGMKAEKYEKKLHVRDSLAKAGVTKRFAKAKKI